VENENTNIKDMKLYVGVERIYNELRELGYNDTDSLEAPALFPFDQYHYFGTDTVDEGIRRAGITAESLVLDVGSGLGGPARYLAHNVGCRVTAVEIQPDVNKTAADLTRRCGLDHLVKHVCADFLESNDEAKYDVIVSWLAFLHIPDRDRLLRRCLDALKPAGVLFVEDFHEIGRFTDEERCQLLADVYCEYLPSLGEFREQCRGAGFTAIDSVDSTQAAIAFSVERAQAFIDNRPRQVRVHGKDVADGLQHFFSVIGSLFEGGHFGFGNVLAKKTD
jgi:cyclopropane fatty-acyl-phospholipid synthase-like methyltransferase